MGEKLNKVFEDDHVKLGLINNMEPEIQQKMAETFQAKLKENWKKEKAKPKLSKGQKPDDRNLFQDEEKLKLIWKQIEQKSKCEWKKTAYLIKFDHDTKQSGTEITDLDSDKSPIPQKFTTTGAKMIE